MLRLRHALAVLGPSMCFPFPAYALVGEATPHQDGRVAGQNGLLVVKDPVYRDERIRTSIGGLAAIPSSVTAPSRRRRRGHRW